MARGGYDFDAIELKWQGYWLGNKTFKSILDSSKPKYYVLDMFPYPSGAGLHVGHPEGYTATDIIARYKRMNGFNVLHPMGWDAFGLPAERHAVRTGEHPAVITNQNCDTFRRQIQRLGLSYDWDREINTTDPGYYKWTQWIFQVLFARGLAYQTEAPVNWCPAIGTVLANEEVKDGKYVETGDPVEKRMLRQWMLRITAYAERLLEGLEELDWPEGIKAQQRDWIGRSEGADIEFAIFEKALSFTVFTTRPDTLFGATYCVLAPEHPLVEYIATPDQMELVKEYIAKASKRSAQDRMKEDREKTGVFTGAYAVNPANGRPLPIWIADYVLAEYGYGAIMAVPGQDQRDWDFAEKFDLPVIRTVEPPEGFEGLAYTGDGPAIDSDFLDGLHVAEAKKQMIAWLEERGHGKGTVTYRLRDWLFSRQRYWGEPFPLIHLEDGTIKCVPTTDLPVMLPELDEYKPTDDGAPPLARATEWVNTVDPETGLPAKRETNTMPQWAGSCWYFLRFVDAQNDREAWSREAESYWMPVDLYIGGAEHAVLHLLYARFWHMVLYDAGFVHTKEPFRKLFNQGMILAYSYRDDQGKYYYPSEVERGADERFRVKTSRKLVETQVEKMSKSRYNVVNPDDVIRDYGADSMRLYEMFMGPLDRDKPWTEEGVQGVHRFLKRVWALFVNDDDTLSARVSAGEIGVATSDPALVKLLHQTIKSVTHDIEHMLFNTAISRMMEFVNAAYKSAALDRETAKTFVLVLSPFAPHIAEELWERLGNASTLAYEPWPRHDEALLVEDTVEIPVQINGKFRARLVAPAAADGAAILELARNHEDVRRHINGKKIVKEIVVPGKLVNFVVK